MILLKRFLDCFLIQNRGKKTKLSEKISDKQSMKKLSLFFAIAVFFFSTTQLFAAELTNYQDFELDTLLHGIEKPGAPVITDDYIIFTAAPKYRYVGIVFDFENYKVIHPFEVLTKTNDDETKTPVHMFYCYKRQHKFTQIKYRLIFDGLWTTDPLNPVKEYDDSVNLYFSKVENLKNININTEITKNDTVHFIYKGESGQKVRLAGTFTNWDSWIYELNETSPGLYELDLPLPLGKYFYNYYIGLTAFLDNTNPNKVYTKDGRSASVIEVR